jgi:ABC-type uncharacterized transport system permease subunit
VNGFLGDWIGAIPVFAAPFLLATTGLIVNERAGVLNLGAEGIMSMGAVAAVITMLSGFGLPLAIVMACVAALGMTALFALLTVVLRLEQVLSGLVIFAFGVGLSGVIGDSYANQPIKALGPVSPALFASLPSWLARLIDQDPLTYFAFILPFIVWWVLERTELGLRLRSVGENAPAADAAGVNVMGMRFAAVLVGGIILGLAGAHLSLVGSRGRPRHLLALEHAARHRRCGALWRRAGGDSAAAVERPACADLPDPDAALCRDHRGALRFRGGPAQSQRPARRSGAPLPARRAALKPSAP